MGSYDLYAFSPFLPRKHYLTWHQDDISTTASGANRTWAGNDRIIADKGTWQATDLIDGGGGQNTISGYFPADWSGEFLPAVRNVQIAELMADANLGQINFSNWTG